jgi:hypothetical protein
MWFAQLIDYPWNTASPSIGEIDREDALLNSLLDRSNKAAAVARDSED